ncbi:hypothetical protein PO688_000001, partial [Listeria monocytogenes]|nr:hypothetical protein [Listeria monocytogenes]
MITYYFNNKADDKGRHEVHERTCRYLPENKTEIGVFSSCQDAIRQAKLQHFQKEFD